MTDWYAKKNIFYSLYCRNQDRAVKFLWSVFVNFTWWHPKKVVRDMWNQKRNKIYHSNFYLNWEKIEYKTKGIILNALWKWPVVLGEMLRF